MRTADLRCRACGSVHVRRFGRKQGYLFAQCAQCDFIFLPSIGRQRAESRYKAHDSAESRRRQGVPEEGWSLDAEFLRPAFDRLQNDRSLTILDFGCGQSGLPDQLRARGHRTVGVDLAPPAEPHPDRLTGDILQLNLRPSQFDLIYSYQVFEHLPEPRPVLDELLRLLVNEGLLLIHTDMDTPHRAGGFFDWYYVMPPMHCSYYRLPTFSALLEHQPAEIVWSDAWSVLIQKEPESS